MILISAQGCQMISFIFLVSCDPVSAYGVMMPVLVALTPGIRYIVSPTYDMFRDLMSSDVEEIESEDTATLWGVADDGEFVLLKVSSSVYQFTIKDQKLTKVFELLPEDGELQRIFPCMMIWPPIFPSRNRACEPENRSARPDNRSAGPETVLPENVSTGIVTCRMIGLPQPQVSQKHAPMKLGSATSVRRQLILSQEGGQEHAPGIVAKGEADNSLLPHDKSNDNNKQDEN